MPKTRDSQDFIDFANILKIYYGLDENRVLNQEDFVKLLFEKISNVNVDSEERISSDLGTYLYKRSIYPNVSTVLLSTLNKNKFRKWITNKSVSDDAVMELLKKLEGFIHERPRFDDADRKKLLKLCTLDAAGEFVAEIFVNILSAPDGEQKIHTRYITDSGKKAVQYFVGRIDELNDIKTQLELDTPQAIWIHGMGGLGKTQLCRKLFYDLDGQFPFMGWVVFDGDFKHSIVRQVICEKDESDMEQAYRDTLEYINRNRTGLVLFIDNVTKEGLDTEELKKLNCHVIVTSRDSAPDTFTEKALGFLSLSECKKLFYSYYKKKKDDLVNEVIHRAGYLTLAVELLAKTARNIDISIAELQAKLIDKSFDLKTVVDTNWDNDEAAQNKAVSDQFRIVFSFSGLMDSPDKLYVLKNMSVLPYLATRQKLLCEWLDLDHERNVIHDLYASGWLQQDEDGYLMHPIISYTVKAELMPTFEDCGKLVSTLAERIALTNTKNVFDALEYVPYAQTVADYLISIAESIHKDLLPYLPFLCIRLATVFSESSQFETALRYGRIAQAIAKNVIGMEHHLLADMYNSLAEIFMDSQHDNDEGVRYAKLAIREAEVSEGFRQYLLPVSYQNLAGLLLQQGDISGALDAVNKAVDNYHSLNSDETATQLANTYRLLSSILLRIGDPAGACESMELCIPIIEKIYKDHPNQLTLAIVYSNYAQALCCMLDRLDDAIVFLKKSIVIRKSNNSDDPRLASLYNKIAWVYIEQRKYTIASEYLMSAIGVAISARQEDAPSLSNTYYLMAKIYFLSNDHRQSIIYAKKSIAIKTTAQDELGSCCLIARCYNALGELERFKRTVEEVVSFKNDGELDPANVEHYSECMELYENLTNK